MKKLLSLPTNLVRYFNAIKDKDPETWFCASDPPGNRIRSGYETSWILKENWKSENGNFLR